MCFVFCVLYFVFGVWCFVLCVWCLGLSVCFLWFETKQRAYSH